MILTKKDLKEYIGEDKKANNFYGFKSIFSPIKHYLISLRKTEYYVNCKKKIK